MARKQVEEKTVVEQSELKPSPDGEANGVDGVPEFTKKVRKRKVKIEEDQDDEPPVSTPKAKKRKVKVEEGEEVIELSSDDEAVEKKVKKKRKRKRSLKTDEEKAAAEALRIATPKRKRKRDLKTDEEKAAAAMPIATRTIGHKLLIGAHVSAAGGKYLGNRFCNYRKH